MDTDRREEKRSRRTRGARGGTDTPGAIRSAALRCFAHTGIDGSTTRAIAAETGVTEGALYRHYRSKEEIVRAVFEEAAGRLVERLEREVAPAGTFPERIEAIVRGFWGFARDDADSFKLLAGDHFTRVSFLPPGTRLPKDVVIEACRTAPSLACGDPALAAAFVVGITLRSIGFFRLGLVGLSPDRALRETVRACLRAVGRKRA